MRRSPVLFNLLGAVGLVGLLSGCGSGGGGAATGIGGTASGSSAASGTITNFGSVYINGTKYEIDDSTSTSVDGSAPVKGDGAAKSILRRGMVVKVSGTFNGSSRTAITITQEDTLDGPIQNKVQVDTNNGALTILGQIVLVDDTTKFDDSIGPNKLDSLALGDVVEVNGFVKDGTTGIIVASFIEKKTLATNCDAGCEIKGIVKAHNHTTTTFQIGGLTVNYAAPASIGDMPSPSGNNWDGLFVEVKGTRFDSATMTLIASKVEPENEGVGNNMDEFEVEGFVRQVDGPGDFFIGMAHVQTTASTEFRGGTIDEIIVGAKLSAEGRLANGILTAKHVKFHASVKLEGNIATINGNTVTIAGLPGVTVTVNSQTEFKADSGNTLSDLSVGKHVRVRGRAGSSNSVIATRVEQRSPDTDVDLQGPVQSISGQVLTILGVDVDTTGIDNTNFEGLNGQVIGRAAFFNAVKEETLVKVKGRLDGAVVTWREAELED
jgi:hypothetical protein